MSGTDCRGCGLANHASWCPEVHPPKAVPGEWMRQANCADAEMFPKGPEETLRAKSVCLECPVKEACLLHALAAPEREGIWGAATPYERSCLGRSPSPQRVEQHFKNVGRRIEAALS